MPLPLATTRQVPESDLAASDPILLLPALPARSHAAPWLATDWVHHGETHLRGFQLFAVEQRMTDRNALMPVIVVLTGDRADCITVERFKLSKASALNPQEWATVWARTKATLKHAGARLNPTPQGHVPLTALPSLPPSLSLVQLPPVPLSAPSTHLPSGDEEQPHQAADFRHHQALLIQNINLRRLGLGGRAGFRLPPAVSSTSSRSVSLGSGATPAQQLHFLQAYQLPIPPPSTSSGSTQPGPGRTRDFTRTVLALGRTVQHALALFGLGPVKTYLSSSVRRAMQQRSQADKGAPGALTREVIERGLLETLLDRSTGTRPGSADECSPPPVGASAGFELELEDWAEALGLPLPPIGDRAGASSRQGPDLSLMAPMAAGPREGAMLLEGDGLLCDTTVAALSVFRLAYAERFVVAPASRTGAGARRLPFEDDGSLLPPSLLAALLSLVVATRGKMVVLGGAGAGGTTGSSGTGTGTLRRRKHGSTGDGQGRESEEEKVPKDPLAKRERFLRCVEAFQRSHPSAFPPASGSSTCPPVLTPAFLAALSTLYAARVSPSTSPLSGHLHHHHHLPHLPTARVRDALSSAFGSGSNPAATMVSPGPESYSTAPSEADTPSQSEVERDHPLSPHAHPGRRRRALPLPLPLPLTALHLPFGGRPRGSRGEEAETVDLERFVRVWVHGEEAPDENGGGRSAAEERAPSAGGSGPGDDDDRTRSRLSRRRRRRRRLRGRASGKAGSSVRGLWASEEEEDIDGEAEEEEQGGNAQRGGEKGGSGTLDGQAGPLQRRRADDEAGETTAAGTDAESVYTARTGLTAPSTLTTVPSPSPPSLASASASASGVQARTATTTTTTATNSTSTAGGVPGPVKFGRGVLRGVKEAAGRAGRKLGDELGLGMAEGADSADGRRTSREGPDEPDLVGLAPPLVVVSASSSRSQSPRASTRASSHPSSSSAPPAESGSSSRAAALSSRLSAALSLPSSGSTAPSSSSAAHSRAPSPRGSSSVTSSRRALAALETNLPGGRPDSAAARASPVSSTAGGTGPSRSLLSLSVPPGGDLWLSRPGAPPMRRAVSETHPRRGLVLARDDDEDERQVEGSLLFGAEDGGRGTKGETSSVDGDEDQGRDRKVEELEEGDGEEAGEDEDGALRVSEKSAVSGRPIGELRHLPRRRGLSRRHSINLVEDAPEPVVWLSRRALEVDVNLRAAAWDLQMKEKRLKDMVAALEAVQRAYDQALSCLAGPLARKEAELNTLSAAATQLTVRVEAHGASTSPLAQLATGTSRLQYGQAVLDDKLRDIVEFDRAVEARIRPGEGTFELAVRELERDLGSTRWVLGVLERAGRWVGAKVGGSSSPAPVPP